MERINVTLRERSYPIIIASGLFNNPLSFWPLTRGDDAMLVVNDHVSHLYSESLSNRLSQVGIKVDKVILPNGEQSKSLTTLNQIFNELLNKSHGRDTTIIALGGGVIGDLAGFAAAIYQRGVRFIQVPTTLLSQVDSSVGGKTAINHPLGKNMIGAFYQPASVIIDFDCLNTLPQREISSGLAEVIKYAIAFDYKFFIWLEQNIDKILLLDHQALKYCICHCCKIKANLVAIDEYEYGKRTLLNLGHTYGHAIETYMGYGNWLHGEAVAAGIMMAINTSRRINNFSNTDTERVISLLLRAGLPISGPIEMSAKDYLPYMKRDKKLVTGKLRLVLPLTLGNAEIYTNVNDDLVIASINDCKTQ